MRVLQINAVNGIASTGRTMLELSGFLEKNNVESYCAYAIGDKKYNNSYIIGNKLDWKIHALLSRLTGLQGYYSKNETQKLIKYIKEIKPDIIHLRNLHNNYINFNLLLKFIVDSKIPLVLTLHDSWFYAAKNQEYNIYFDEIPSTFMTKKDLTEAENPSWFFNRQEKMIRDRNRLMSLIPHIYSIGVSNWVSNQAKNTFLNEVSVIRTIYNWVDTNVFKPRNTQVLRDSLNLENKFIILGVASFWTKNKGIDIVFDLSKSLDKDMIILIVGEISSNNQLPNNVVSVGPINNIEELSRYYSLADVFLNMSVAETFGKVSAEAMACGTPVITNRFTANPEIVSEKTGVVIDKFDSISMIEAVKFIKNNTKINYKHNCVERVNENFSYLKNANEYLELYKEILKVKSNE